MEKLIEDDNVYLDLIFKGKKDLFNFLGDISEEKKWFPKKEVLKAFENREKIGSTGMIDGIIMPHGISESFSSQKIVFIKLNKTIKWEMLDSSKPEIAICLFVPKNNHKNGNHMEIISNISSKLLKKKNRDLLKTSSKKDVLKIFNGG